MSRTSEPLLIAQFPHCDQRVLHAPGECEYCDRHPEWQELREAWGINYTGHHIEKGEYGEKYLPCPSEANRPLGTINMWDGNVPFKNESINTDSAVFPPDAKVLHDLETRHVHVESETEKCPCLGTNDDARREEALARVARIIAELDRLLIDVQAIKDLLG